MRKNKIDDILRGITPDEKKGLLHRLVSALIGELNEEEKKAMFEAVLCGRKKGKQLETMVEQ